MTSIPTRALVAFALTAAAQVAQAVTVFSDDFSAGNPANASAYGLVAAGVFTGPDQYRIVNNPSSSFTNGYASYFDHTLGTANGAMLFFDGSSNTSKAVWFRSVALTAGTSYTFSFWGSSGSTSAPPLLSLAINDALVGTPLATQSATWTFSSYTFTPSTSGSFTFSIVDLVPDSFGNDGAIDDVLLTAVPEPASAALMLGGVAALLLQFRRRRGAA